MALTESEKTELKNDILNAIKAESQSVDELVEVSSLDNIKSLPALRGSELVSAPLTLLRKPADDAAATANASATKADNAAALANKAAGMCNLQIFLCLFLEKLNMPQNTPVTKAS